MTQDPGKGEYVPFDKRPKKDIYALQAGKRVRLADGSVCEITNNPLDGVWMIVKAIGVPGAEEEMILLTDIEGPAQ